MSPQTLPALIFAAGPTIWSFDAWKLRTKNIPHPFDAATSSDPHLESWKLTLINKLERRIRLLPTYDDRVDYILHAQTTNGNRRQALDAWNAWADSHLESWNIHTDVQNILLQFGRHPSQMLAARTIRTRWVSTILITPLSEYPWLTFHKGSPSHRFGPIRRGGTLWRRRLCRSHGP